MRGNPRTTLYHAIKARLSQILKPNLRPNLYSQFHKFPKSQSLVLRLCQRGLVIHVAYFATSGRLAANTSRRNDSQYFPRDHPSRRQHQINVKPVNPLGTRNQGTWPFASSPEVTSVIITGEIAPKGEGARER